jgi:RHS repeat-associated protein
VQSTRPQLITFSTEKLLATVDQQMASGVATGTAKTRYVHPDHLGSTNVVTDENGTVVQTLDYYPYGSTRISSATSTNERRKYMGQFGDDSTLSYLGARYYDGSRGAFLSEDPVFLAIGGSDAEKLAKRPLQQILSDPQSLNGYSYAEDNPISIKDPSGLMSQKTQAALNAIVPLLGQLVNLLSLNHAPRLAFLACWAGARTPSIRPSGSVCVNSLCNALGISLTVKPVCWRKRPVFRSIKRLPRCLWRALRFGFRLVESRTG